MSKVGISELASILVSRHGLSVKDAENFVNTFFDVLIDCLDKDKQVKVKGFGTFKITNVSARESVDINTGERIVIDGRDKISFTPDNTMRDLVNRPFAQFDTVIINDGVDLSSVDEDFQDLNSDNVNQDCADIVVDKPKNKPINVEQKTGEAIEQNVDTYYDNEDKVKPRKRNIVIAIIAFLIIISISCIIYYRFFGRNNSGNTNPLSTDNIKNNTVAPKHKSQNVVKSTAKSLKLSDTTANKESRNVAFKYVDNPFVRTGAYNIIGIAHTVAVREGQTLELISKVYLGKGMECYVQAVNNGKTKVTVGDTINIPELQLKGK